MRKNLTIILLTLIMAVVLICFQNYLKPSKPINISSLVSQKNISGVPIYATPYEVKDITEGWENDKIIEIQGEFYGNNDLIAKIYG